MRSKYLLAITITAVIMAFFFFKDRSESPLQLSDTAAEVENTDQEANVSEGSDKIIEKQAADSKSIKEKTAQNTSAEQIEETELNFSANLKQMGVCLGIQTSAESEKLAPSFENLITSLKPGLGEIVVRMDDWTQTDLKYADGTMKRIRTEIEYLDTGSPVKRAQLYKINDQGMPEMQPLSTDLATDPSEEFLNSLKADGKETLEEKGGRVYYQEGEELVLVERSGKVQSFSLSKGEKTFSCTETDVSTSNCQCL